jgi:HlyD family secretion protein
MVDVDTVWIAAWIDINQMSQIKENQEATIRLRSGRQFPGRIERINVEADAVTREMAVNVKFDQIPDPLVIGEEAEVVINTGSMTAPCAPLTAMTERGGQNGILLVEQGRLVFRPVMAGLNDGKRFTCPRLLKEGDLVVVQPLNLKPGMRVSPEIKAPGSQGK